MSLNNIPHIRVAISLLLPILVLAVLAGLILPLQAAPTAVFYVNASTGNDSNDCLSTGTACATIAGAFAKAASGDTIEIAAGTYNEFDVLIDRPVTLNGAGPGSTIVDAGGNGRIFYFTQNFTLANLTLQNGYRPGGTDIFEEGGGALLIGSQSTALMQNVVITNSTATGSGGAIFNLGNLTIDSSEIVSNTAGGLGGGIYNYIFGSLTVTNSQINDNTAVGLYGGGIYTTRPLTLTDTTLRGNGATTFGGGVFFNTDTAVLTNVTLSGNQSSNGAGFYAQGGNITMTNSTVSGNTAATNFSGIYVTGASTALTLTNSTVANNIRTGTAGTGYNGIRASNNASVTLQNSLVANNQDRQCSTNTNWVSQGNNLASDYYCDLHSAGDQEGVDPLLGTLADNGGPTQTHALQPGSPAIDAGSNANCPATDQRGVARPYDGDNDGTAACDIGAFEAEHQLVIADSSILEGTGGSVTAVFTVTLSPDSSQTVTVDFTTSDGTAAAPADYTATSGTLTFNPGVTQQTILVPIVTDSSDEMDETFSVTLSNASNAAILDGAATGTIIDDDGLASLSINDVTVGEGSLFSAETAVFEVTLSPAAASVVTVNYATVAGTAVAGSDYTAQNGTLTFNPGETSQQIAVPILHDEDDEGSEEIFTVQLSNANNANLIDSTGQGTITDNDTARLAQNVGPSVMEGDSGTTTATFTVTLSTPAAFVVTVDYAINDGYGSTGANYGSDYSGTTSGTLTFQPGETEQTYSIEIIGDTIREEDERYGSTISHANVPITTAGSNAFILNDDNYRVYIPLIIRP